MKTIGLLGGTGWASTIEYYKIINQLMHKKLGGYHSANIILKSIDYHYIMRAYSEKPEKIPSLLEKELKELLALRPDALIICCNSLHKFYDEIKDNLNLQIPIFHAVDLTRTYMKNKKIKKVLFLASKFTMDDGFFVKKLSEPSLEITVPDFKQRNVIHEIHLKLLQNKLDPLMQKQFQDIILESLPQEAIILACSEFSPLIDEKMFGSCIIDPMHLQCQEAVNFSIV